MTKLTPSHLNKSTPPLRVLPVLAKIQNFYKDWIPVHRKVPRTERFGIGARMDAALLDLLMTIRRAGFASGERKIALLEVAISKIDDIRFLFQLFWEIGLISNEQFARFAEKIQEVGKDVGGWRRGVISKTPPP